MGTRRVEMDFKIRPSEPLPRPNFETATTTDLADIALCVNLADIALYVNNKLVLVVVFAAESSPQLIRSAVELMSRKAR